MSHDSWDSVTTVTSDYESYYYPSENVTNTTDNTDYNDTIAWTPPDSTGASVGYTLPHLIVAAISVTMLMIVIIIGNALVIIAIAKDRNLKQLQNWFIASLACSDLMVGLLIMPFSLANELMGHWYFGNFMCELWLAVDVLLCTASILNLCLISLDRYWSITKAISYIKFRTKKRAMLMIAIVWGLSAIICFPPLVGWKRPQPKIAGKMMCVLSEDIGYIIYSTMGSFYIPLTVLIVVYIKIYVAVRQRARRNLQKKKSIATEKEKLKQRQMDEQKTQSTTATVTTEKADDESLSSDESKNVSDEKVRPPEDTDPETNPRLQTIEENHKLLSEDSELTDSAAEFPAMKMQTLHNNTTTVTDTDTCVSDCPYTPEKVNGYKQVNTEDNLKPLVEENEVEVSSPKEKKFQKNGNSNNGSNAKANKRRDFAGHKKKYALGAGSLRRLSQSVRLYKQSTKTSVVKKAPENDQEKQKRKLAKARERRAFIVLGVVMGTFILCWFPFFSTYVISSLAKIDVPGPVFSVFFWAGYCNSALNPIIYTVFNQDFRKAFHKIICNRR